MSALAEAPAAPVTSHRKVYTDDLGKYIQKPNVPRATLAVDKEHPNGSEGHETHGMSVMQQHVAFFDRNRDGVIYPWETFAGFRACGFNLAWSIGAAVVINGAFSYQTIDGWIPSPLFPIVVRNVHKAKHGSDSEVYDNEGRFVPEKFEEIFTKYDRDNKGGLNFKEIFQMTEDNRNAMDFFGWTAEKLEWGITWILLKDKQGVVTKDAIRGMFDASVFEVLERQNSPQKLKSKREL